MKELRDYQLKISNDASVILKIYKVVYLAMQVRTGKTATALNTVKNIGFINVLFLTKKKAIDGIIKDYIDFGFNECFKLTVTNNESLHLIKNNDFDCIIMDEAHRLGSFPKPCKMAKDLKLRFSNLPFIFLSGTPHPESYSQIYHQFWVSNNSPFRKLKNFYQWASECVEITTKNFGYGMINDYSKTKNKDIIDAILSCVMINYSQKEAGFTSNINEHILYCDIETKTHSLINKLLKDKIIQGKENVIIADTAVKLQQKIHQIYSGTVKFESGESMVLDYSKANFIRDHFNDKKIAIFYKFKEELNALKHSFGNNLTSDLKQFNTGHKNIALQIVSGREGISLKEADYLVYYNIDFSALSYWQSRDRLTTMERKTNDIYWIFSKGGIEEKIYKAVQSKKNYTLSVFKKDYEFSK